MFAGKTKLGVIGMATAVLLLCSGCTGKGPVQSDSIKIGISVYDQYDTFVSTLTGAFENAAKEMENETGQVQVTDEVVAIIAGLTATEVEGVASMAGNITKDIISRLGMKNLSKGVRIEMQDHGVAVMMALNIAYGYSLPEVSATVQNKVKTAIENMTGLDVASVNIRIADVDMKTEK